MALFSGGQKHSPVSSPPTWRMQCDQKPGTRQKPLDFPGEQKEDFTDTTQDKNAGGWRRPQETRQVRELLGLSMDRPRILHLIAKNPHIKELVTSGHKLSNREEMDEYKKIVQTISPLIGDAGVSIEVFSDEKTTAQEMFIQGQECFRGSPMHTSNIHARLRGFERHRIR